MKPIIIIVAFIASVYYASEVPCSDPTRVYECADPNELYNCCGTACERNCSTLNVEIICIELCVEGCFCRDGYVRQYDNGPCVLKEACPATTTSSPPSTTTTPGCP
ncbi:hypothetical protein RP20_CCG023609 [Aedes albopictus]|nr:hypothetical protein RP20_CCG023609 [Aedes albopictus]